MTIENNTNEVDSDLGDIDQAFVIAANEQPQDTTGLQAGSPQTEPTPPSNETIPEQPTAPQQMATQEIIGGSAPASQAGTQQVSPVYALAQRIGLNVNANASDDEIAAAFQSHMRQLEGFAALGQQALSQQVAQQQPPTPPAPKQDEWDLKAALQSKWHVPEWKEEYQTAIDRGLVVKNEQGLYAPAPGYELQVAPILQPLNEAIIQRSNQWTKLMQGNPVEFMYESLIEPIRRQVRQEFEQFYSQKAVEQQQQSFVSQWEAQNKDWFYDASNKPTAEGQWFVNQLAQLDGKMALDQAIRFVDSMRSTYREFQKNLAPPNNAQAQQPAAPQAPTQQAATTTQQQSFVQSAAQRASHTPRAGGVTVQSPDYQPDNISELDLRNLFKNAYRAASGQAAVN